MLRLFVSQLLFLACISVSTNHLSNQNPNIKGHQRKRVIQPNDTHSRRKIDVNSFSFTATWAQTFSLEEAWAGKFVLKGIIAALYNFYSKKLALLFFLKGIRGAENLYVEKKYWRLTNFILKN